MGLARRTFVLGGHTTPFIGKRHPDFIWKRHPDFGQRENPTLEETLSAAIQGAFEATGVDPTLVDRGWVGNFVGELFVQQGHLGAAVVGAEPKLMHKPIMRVEAACASGGLAYSSAIESIQAGADINLVAGVEIQTTESARTGGDYLARAAHYRRQRPIDDFTFPALFAARIQAAIEAGVLTHEDLGRVAAKAYANGNRNPLAHMKAVTMTLEQAAQASDKNPNFLSNEALSPYLKMSDCSQVSDGASALLLVSEQGLAKLGKTPADATEVLGYGHATGNLYTDGDPLFMDVTHAAASKAYAQSGLTAGDIQVAEVHDCFTIAEILMYEALGFADRGQGAQLVREGRTELDGDLPVNTGGGLISFGHPVGATGVKQVLEVHKQLHGQAGDYQIGSNPEVGLTANMGGSDKTAVVSVLRRSS